MLTLLPTLAAALSNPAPRTGALNCRAAVDARAPAAALTPSRRSALQGAAAALLPLTGVPGAALARGAGLEDGREAGLGGTGALRSDLAESLTGSGVEITITDLSYKELEVCPKKFFLPAKGGPWTCIEVSATAYNQGKRDVQAADVFGQIYDKEGYSPASTALDPSQKAPITTLEGSFPKGKKVPVTWVTAVQSRSPRPFRFAGMKGNYRNAAMAKTFQAFDPCELDSSQCDEDEDQPTNANALREGKGYQYGK